MPDSSSSVLNGVRHDANGSSPAIHTRALTKHYSGGDGVKGLDLEVPRGCKFGLLGPNGAGKSTTIKMLMGLLTPTSGDAAVLGNDIGRDAVAIRSRVGYVPERHHIYQWMTVGEVIWFTRSFYPNWNHAFCEELLSQYGLDTRKKVKQLSHGMTTKLALTLALSHEPELLLLDEPTTGLDPQNRTNIWDYIRNLKEQSGLTLLITTHYMDEAEALADRVSIIDHGRVVVEGTPREMVEHMGADRIQISGQGDSSKFINKVQGLSFVQSVTTTDGLIQVGVDSGNQRLAEVVGLASGSGFTIEDISVAKPSLGDVFLKYTGRQLRDT